MQLEIALGSARLVMMGPSEETKFILENALEVADASGDLHAQARALAALAGVYVFREDDGKASAAVERLRDSAQRLGDPAIVADADRRMGNTLLTIGKPREAQCYLERVLQYPVLPDRERPIFWSHSDRALARAMLAHALWLQGFAEKALREALGATDELHGTEHQLSFCRVLYFGICRIAPMAGDFAAADRANAGLIEVATTLNAPLWKTVGHFLEGKLLIERGEFGRRAAVLREAFRMCGETGWRVSYPEFRGALAIALAGLEHLDEALTAVTEALEKSGASEDGQWWYVPELLRIKGGILLRRALDRSTSGAADCLNEASQIARHQGSLSWALRAATSLARLLRNQGRPADAKGILQPVYDRFAEGFGTADLTAAKRLLDELSDAGRE
jgi:tetratricopeptide (TPR) repeat protein